MISRRSKPRSLFPGQDPMTVESPTMEGAAGEGDGIFFCVAATSRGKKGKMSYFRSNAAGEDAEAARALSALCLDHAPEHHRWHHHTVDGRRTFAFLAADDGCTYFAVADPTPGSAETIRFLERVRDACDAAPRKRMRDDAVAHVVRQFVQTLQAAVGTAATSSSTANAVISGEKDDEALRAVQPEDQQGARRPRQLSWRRTWWRRHAMAVIGVDVVLCLLLFGVWMAVCHGFRCVHG